MAVGFVSQPREEMAAIAGVVVLEAVRRLWVASSLC